MKRTCAALLVSTLIFPNCAARGAAFATHHGDRAGVATDSHGQESPEVWRQFARKLPIGSVVKIRTSAERITASLLVVDDTGILVKARTRVAEPARHVTFDRIEQLEVQRGDTSSLAKAAAVGGAVGAGAFVGFLLIFAALVGD